MFSWCCPTAVPCCRPSADQGAGKVQPQLKPSAASRAATLVSLTGKPKVVAESVLAVLLQHTLSLYTTQGEAVCIRCTFSPTQCACRVLVYSISLADCCAVNAATWEACHSSSIVEHVPKRSACSSMPADDDICACIAVQAVPAQRPPGAQPLREVQKAAVTVAATGSSWDDEEDLPALLG